MNTTLLDAAMRLRGSGVLAFPASATAKHPDRVDHWAASHYGPSGWPSEEQHRQGFSQHDVRRCFVVCGARSGNIACFDVDDSTLFAAFWNLIPPQIRERLYREKSQRSGGYHVVGRFDGPIPPSWVPARDAERKVRIELRGEGSGFMAAPSLGYERVQGDIGTLPPLSMDDFAAITDAAASFNQWEEPEIPPPPPHTPRPVDADDRPGDRYNRENGQAEVVALLQDHGWRSVGNRGECVEVLRPGGPTSEQSGNVDPRGVLHVFSTSAYPFEASAHGAGKPYDPFAVYALLEHGGNFSAAGKALEQSRQPMRAHRGRAEGDATDEPEVWTPPTDTWPVPLAEEAFYGIVGEIVRAIEPHTEADPAALLIQLLVAAGNCIGRSPHFMAEADYHALNLFTVLVGDSAKGRKGTSWGHIRRIFESVDAAWMTRIMDGLSSGEGLIHEVRDPQTSQRDGEKIIEPGVADKRLLVQAPEFANVLRVQMREGSTLSGVLRTAWDRGGLQTMVRKNPLTATHAHISIVGHVTRDELLRLFEATDAANGFGNRFLWFAVRRSKLLPLGGRIGEVDFAPLTDRLTRAVQFARTVGEITRDEAATEVWCDVYAILSDAKPGMLGAMTARAEAQVMRLACLYAVLDTSRVIREEHLLAALAVWAYSAESARWIFGDRLGDPVADEILRSLRMNPDGITRTEVSDLFGRHKNANQITTALHALEARGMARCGREAPTGGVGRHIERWYAART